jgi:hypothetical protein
VDERVALAEVVLERDAAAERLASGLSEPGTVAALLFFQCDFQ